MTVKTARIRAVLVLLALVGWLACIVYATVPAFWLLVHGRAEWWREWRFSPYWVLLPAWFAMWMILLAVTWRFKNLYFYSTPWSWIPAGAFFAIGFSLYLRGASGFSFKQLGGVPELYTAPTRQRLVTSGIRQRVRHPVYLAHLIEMLAWSTGTGLIVCFALTALAVATGAVMIRAEDAELEHRFGEEFRNYKATVPAVIPETRHV